ncbi:hypothetical protein GQL44_16650 [Escherichia coli]|nr:hypothetical protein [Escherichia coli]EFH3696554.1 hypothetical protein [Escherichia coli]
MFENYVCKIYVSNDPHFSSHLEATAFGFDNGQQQKILTAAHVVTRGRLRKRKIKHAKPVAAVAMA